jgi:predicted 2-oxoglutarate/Fe(II)-dependent dioxygenase YbiX
MPERPRRPASGADLLREVGALAIPRAADRETCSRLIGDLAASPRTPTSMTSEVTFEAEVYPDYARSKTVAASPLALQLVEGVLAAQLAKLEGFFGRSLEWNSEIHFLTYEEGDFIRPHCDLLEGEGVPQRIRERVGLFSLFVNGCDGPDGDGYEGGEFVLHPERGRRLTVRCKAGMLLAFRPELVHAVQPVLAGRRHAVAGWFREPTGGL